MSSVYMAWTSMDKAGSVHLAKVGEIGGNGDPAELRTLASIPGLKGEKGGEKGGNPTHG